MATEAKGLGNSCTGALAAVSTHDAWEQTTAKQDSSPSSILNYPDVMTTCCKTMVGNLKSNKNGPIRNEMLTLTVIKEPTCVAQHSSMHQPPGHEPAGFHLNSRPVPIWLRADRAPRKTRIKETTSAKFCMKLFSTTPMSAGVQFRMLKECW